MTSNGDPVLNAISLSAAPRADRLDCTPPPRPSVSKAASPSSKENHSISQNAAHDQDDAQNESEAETVVLSPEKKMIKTERIDDDDVRLRSIKEESRAHSPLTNGHRRSSDGKDGKSNGAKHGSERDAKSPPTSPSSRTTSRHTKDTSPSDSTKSPVHTTLSPTQTVTRGRSASTVESRKRKVRDDSFPKSTEPPRQKARTEGLKEPRQPISPVASGFGRLHKRSQSTQSAATGVPGRKRRETTNLALSVESSRWPEESSDDNSSSPPAHTPNNPQHVRVKRSSHRALTSPARTMPKSKTDRFGATRLARESEKGDLDAVKEAYEEAPDELNQVDYAGIAPLQKASLHGWAEVVRYLISKGCNTACESNDRDTPLIDAVENAHLDVIKLLLNEGHVNPHHANKKGQRAIDVMEHDDDNAEEIEKLLREAMKRETNTSRDEKQPERKQAKTASRLLYNEFNVETLIEKAGDGDILAVGELINSNIKPNITCGVAAARGGHYDILSILLASGLKADPDPSKHPETPMTVAIGRGHLKIIQLLLEQDNFDPTRRNKENKAYYEIAEEKAGPKWEMERDVLKQAYDEHKGQHRSPRRVKKEPPHLSAIRMKRSSLPKRDRSLSPRPEAKRAHLTKSITAPQKSRRLMSGKEMANREGQRRKRVVEDESSEEESEEDVRPPTRKVKPRACSLGEENKPVKQPLKVRSDDNDTAKRKVRAQSDESDEDHGSKPPPKIRKRLEQPRSAKPTPEVDSPDERKPVKNKIKIKTIEDVKIRKRKMSDASVDDHGVKKTPNVSAKSTPAPPERTATPEAMRERRQEEHRLETEARKKAAEAVAEAEKKRKEDEEAARKTAEEAEVKRKAEAEAEALRQAEEAESTRKREFEEAQRRADEDARRQEMLLARQDRISKLPRALRRACELGHDRPLHFSGERLGVSAVFLPLFYATSQDLHEPSDATEKTYVCSFQVAGILGLPELDLAHLDAPYSEWPRLPVTHKQRDAILRQYDVALLAQEFRFPMEGSPDFDYAKIQDSIREAKNQFLTMDGLYWVEESLVHAEVEKVESLQPLLDDLKPECGKRRFRLTGINESIKSELKPKPKKSFMDIVLAQSRTNGVHVNGDAG
jgi:ankyrin repeat protein